VVTVSDAFSPEQLAQLEGVVRKAVREEMGDFGLRVDGPDHIDQAREDFRFMRRLRKAVDGVASKVGIAVIMAILGAVLWLVNSGMNFWKGS
jgi:hypothetical protein